MQTMVEIKHKNYARNKINSFFHEIEVRREINASWRKTHYF
jgi:hypothetical protein